ncbi:MAG: EpsI family protein [Gammaproteobacteria bacterium]|nr:EpsI family protein [Gammaproteobacteria bacterium]
MIKEQTKNTWRFAGPLMLVMLMITLVLYQHTALYLISLWNQLDAGEYAHGYLVLAISIYLIFNHKQELSTLTPHPEYRALLVVFGASMLWMVAALVNVEMLQAVAFLILVLAIVWSVLGNQVIRLLAFPILFIAFAIPIWFPLSPTLQNITADVVFGAIRVLSVPAFRQDNMIILPAGTLSIEEACSGLRYLLAALTLGTLYAYMNYFSLRARLVVVLVAAGSAVLANMLRVFIVVYLGYTTEMQHPLVADHLSLGWYLFAGLVTILLFVDSQLHKKYLFMESDELVMPNDIKKNIDRKIYPYYIAYAVLTGMLICVAPLVVYQASTPSVSEEEKYGPVLPQEAGVWLSTLDNSDNWSPVYHGAINQKQIYEMSNNKVILYMGYYPVQKQGEELINDLNHISTKDGWRSVYPRPLIQQIEDKLILEQVLDNGEKEQRLVWFWYNVAGTVTTNKYEAKFLQVLGLLTGKTWAYIAAVAVDKNDDVDISRRILKDFIGSIEEPIKSEIERITVHH